MLTPTRATLAALCGAALLLGGCGDDAGGSSGGGSGGDGGPSSGTSQSTAPAAGTSVTGGGEDDPYATERQVCVDKINELRATESLPAYGRWGDAEACCDDEATADEQSGEAHGAFGMCEEHGQNECLGHGPEGIAECLDQMWAEKDLPECTGCSLCHGEQGDCANCVFNVCGHYVNMSAEYFTEAACGFSDEGGWNVINFR